MFRFNYMHLGEKACKTIYEIRNNTRSIGKPTIEVSLTLFDPCVKPFLLYGSELWGVEKYQLTL